MAKRWRKAVLGVLLAGLAPMAWGLNSATITVAGNEQQVSGNWDQGQIKVEFNGYQETVLYGQFSTAASVASALAAKFSNDYLPQGLCAIANGAQITFKLRGTAAFGTLDVGGSTASFQLAPSGFAGSVVGNADTGTVTLTVNGVTAATATYGQGSTPETVADALADSSTSFTGSPVNVSRKGYSGLEFTSKTSGDTTDYSYSVAAASTAGYSTPSFTSNPTSGNLEGGANPSSSTGQPVYSYTVHYQPNSNVDGYIDSVMGTWAFSYDTLNRLATSMRGTGPTPPTGFQDLTAEYFHNYCWYYDQWGNRLDAEGSATAYSSTAGGASPCSGQPIVQYNTNNQMTGSGAPSYDQAGDATSDAKGRQYLYDAEGRICAVKGAAVDGISAMVGYVYDADGNRVAKGPITSWSCDPTTNGFENSAYETDYVLNQSGQTVTETTKSDTGVMQWNFTNVYANGVLFATYDAQGLHFLLNDWLGTRRASTDYEGVLESLCASLPYGDGLNCTNSPQSPNEQHFTGKQHDQESGNDYFGARYYSENDARFMSPDWSAKVEPVPYAKMDDPQSLNLYGYMLDSPLDGVDQDGHCDICYTLITTISSYVATHPDIGQALQQLGNSVGIKLTAGIGRKVSIGGVKLGAAASVTSEARVDGTGSSKVQVTGAATVNGVGIQGNGTATFEKNGSMVNPLDNLAGNAKLTGSLAHGDNASSTNAAAGTDGRAAVGVGVNIGVAQAGAQVTAGVAAVQAVVGAVVKDTVQDVEQLAHGAASTVSCAGPSCGISH